MDHVFEIPLYAAEAIASQGTLTTPGIDARMFDSVEALRYRSASASGTAALKIEIARGELARAADGTIALVAGVDEAAQATYDSFDDADDLEDDTSGVSTTDGWHSLEFPAIRASFFKLKFTGLGANPADTLLDAVLVVREVV